VFGTGSPQERTRDGAVISKTDTFFVAVIFLALLASLLSNVFVLANDIWMSRYGILSTGTVVSNRIDRSGDHGLTFAMIAYTPLVTGSKPQNEVRAELIDEGWIEVGTSIPITYDPGNLSYVRVAPILLDWSLIMIICLFALIEVVLGHNLIRRLRGQIVYPREPEHVDYTPTAAEDAEFDRNQAAGTSALMAEVDGKWIRLKGKALKDSQREDRQSDRAFMAVGIIFLLTAIGGLTVGLVRPSGFEWTDLILPFFCFPFGAGFCFVAYHALRQNG
jgi:hypothetical protein